MNLWMLIFIILSLILSFLSFLPALNFTTWLVRVFDYVRVQLLLAMLVLFSIGCFIINLDNTILTVTQFILLAAMVYQIKVMYPYLLVFKSSKKPSTKPNTITMLSVNVYQENTAYNKLVELVKQYQPDILLAMETDLKWEKALSEIEHMYPEAKKIPKNNTYGMHLYTKLKVQNIKEHYFISDERPAIEAHLTDSQNNNFIFWGIHPPPPGPTEMPTSKQKDAELMTIAKRIRKLETPCIVAGDFNCVSWSGASKLFSKISKLKDARLGNGFLGTFPAKPKIFRIPIDLLFYSKGIELNKIETLPDIDSDHLPLFAKFTIQYTDLPTNKKLKPEIKEIANEIIKEGNEEEAEETED